MDSTERYKLALEGLANRAMQLATDCQTMTAGPTTQIVNIGESIACLKLAMRHCEDAFARINLASSRIPSTDPAKVPTPETVRPGMPEYERKRIATTWTAINPGQSYQPPILISGIPSRPDEPLTVATPGADLLRAGWTHWAPN